MEYRFVIQASNPRTLSQFDPDDSSLFDAIQTVFPLEAEYALLTWNWVYIPLDYKYDWCLLVDEVISLVECMTSEQSGSRTIHWPSNTFSAVWDVEWADGKVTVNATWKCVLG